VCSHSKCDFEGPLFEPNQAATTTIEHGVEVKLSDWRERGSMEQKRQVVSIDEPKQGWIEKGLEAKLDDERERGYVEVESEEREEAAWMSKSAGAFRAEISEGDAGWIVQLKIEQMGWNSGITIGWIMMKLWVCIGCWKYLRPWMDEDAHMWMWGWFACK
jgi:hypothetical protein